METLYKVLAEDGTPCHGGTGQWALPTHQADRTWAPGAWMPKIARIQPCQRGYHVCTAAQLPRWLGPALYTVEVRGARIGQADKVVVAEARLLAPCAHWTARTARLFAADCAAHVLAPDADARSWAAITTARRYATGQATCEELAAARAAAWDAARAAAQAVAGAAARAAAWDAAQAAEQAAARDAAQAAEQAAARAAAQAAEQAWQADRLHQYLRGEAPAPIERPT